MAATRPDGPANPIARLLARLLGKRARLPPPPPTGREAAVPPATAVAQGSVLPDHPDPPREWTEARVAVAERLFGAGCVAPSGEEYLKRLIAPLHLGPGMSVLEIGAGLGGNARTIAAASGARVVALESDPVLAHAGMRRSTEAGAAETAPVRAFSPPDLAVAEGTFDAAFARQAFFRFPAKEAVYQAVHTALRPGGDLLFTELVLARPQSTAVALRTWIAQEEVHPWTLRETTSALQRIGFEVRVTAEVTADLRHLILGAWARFAKDLTAGMDRGTAVAVLAEGELWLRRLGLIDAGELVAYRLLARKGGG